MINQKSIDAVNQSLFSKQFKKPLYESFCFSRIPASVLTLLTGQKKEEALPSSCFLGGEETYDFVLFLFLDGLPWRLFEKHSDHPFFRRFIEKGVVSKTTAQFPSTTAAQVTTIHTGLEVGQTGIYEWFQYEPQVDRMIAPLLFSYAGDLVVESLRTSGVPSADFFPFHTIYQDLHSLHVSSFLFQHAGICSTPYSQSLGKGAHLLSYFNLAQGLQGVQEVIHEERAEKAYAMLYYADIDSVGHRKGPNSNEMEQTILHCLDVLEQELMLKISNPKKKVALLVSADHGMSSVHPKKTLYVNREIPQFSSLLKVGRNGKPLTPAGSCRDCFFHIKEECLDEAALLLEESVKGKAEVWRVEELIQQGFFGAKPVSSRFLQRVGNLVALSYEEEGIWWYEKHRFEQHFYGAHGGLTSSELETPFLFLPL